MDQIYDYFPPASEHFCWCDEANFSLFKASIYSAPHCSARKLFFSLATDTAARVLYIVCEKKAPIWREAAAPLLPKPNREVKIHARERRRGNHSLIYNVCLSSLPLPCLVKVWVLSRPPRLFRSKRGEYNESERTPLVNSWLRNNLLPLWQNSCSHRPPYYPLTHSFKYLLFCISGFGLHRGLSSFRASFAWVWACMGASGEHF